MFGVLIFCLNESKFIGYALRGYLSSPLVKKIAVTEGCVKLNAHAANEHGLSVDNTAEVVQKVMAEDETNRIVYERMGWVENKSVLQTRCIQLIEDTPGIKYYILAGADEVYDPADLAKLKDEIKRLNYPDVPVYEFVHFWKRPDLRATGSMWQTWMHRCYRNHGKGMHFIAHAGPPVKPDGGRLQKAVETQGVKVYHYTGMKDEQDIKDRLKFYQARDGKGKDTWTDWSPGKPTQWTHGGGTAEPYHGKHPPVIADDVWKLVPGKMRLKTKVFISHEKEHRDRVRDFVVELSGLCPVTVVGLVNPRWKGVEFRKLSNLKAMLKDIDMVIVANQNLTLIPKVRYNVILAYLPMPEHRPFRSGYRIICFDEKAGKTWSGKAAQVNGAAEFLAKLADLPIVQGIQGEPYPTYSEYSQMTGSIGRPSVPGKLGKTGSVRIVSTRPLVAVWDFTNPLNSKLDEKRSHIGYEIRLASGRVLHSKRTVVKIPNLPPGHGFQVELVLPLDLPPSEYVAAFDFRTKDGWASDAGIAPLEIMYSVTAKGEVWVR